MTIPLNQVYKEELTLEQYPNVKKVFDELTKFSIDNNFFKPWGAPGGRRYDAAVLYQFANFENKKVCELGARDGLFSSWLTKEVSEIYVSDYFEEWGKDTEYDLGQIGYWENIWKNTASHPEKMVVERQDLTNLTYPDNTFDITICTSVIEHCYNQQNCMGDIIAMKEICRITKPNGIILLSTDMAEDSLWLSGTHYYSEADLFERLINPNNCEIIGHYDFDVNGDHCTDIHEVGPLKKATSVVFALKKLE